MVQVAVTQAVIILCSSPKILNKSKKSHCSSEKNIDSRHNNLLNQHVGEMLEAVGTK